MGIRNSQRCKIALPSVTYAMRASELLANYNIRSRIISVDTKATRKGCSHGIELDCTSLQRAKDILTDHSIPINTVSGA